MSRRSRSNGARWARRIRGLAVLGGVVAAVVGARRMVLDRDQRAFDERYGARASDRQAP